MSARPEPPEAVPPPTLTLLTRDVERLQEAVDRLELEVLRLLAAPPLADLVAGVEGETGGGNSFR